MKIAKVAEEADTLLAFYWAQSVKDLLGSPSIQACQIDFPFKSNILHEDGYIALKIPLFNVSLFDYYYKTRYLVSWSQPHLKSINYWINSHNNGYIKIDKKTLKVLKEFQQKNNLSWIKAQKWINEKTNYNSCIVDKKTLNPINELMGLELEKKINYLLLEKKLNIKNELKKIT